MHLARLQKLHTKKKRNQLKLKIHSTYITITEIRLRETYTEYILSYF